MATLRAHGKVVLQMEKVTETPNDDLTVRSRRTYVVMSDGALLQKDDVWFKENAAFGWPVRQHSYGWKLYKRHLDSTAEQVRERLSGKGFEVTRAS